jgi:PleD family two-component response regulator
VTSSLLIVDDDRAALFALSEALADLPARLVLATSGEEALRQVLRQRFELVLLDVRMPRMDGFEVAAAIRGLERSRRTPIIFMSAEEDRRRSARGGPGGDYLRKPLEPDMLRAKLAPLLRQGVAA